MFRPTPCGLYSGGRLLLRGEGGGWLWGPGGVGGELVLRFLVFLLGGDGGGSWEGSELGLGGGGVLM
jgi:hypothetical protein